MAMTGIFATLAEVLMEVKVWGYGYVICTFYLTSVMIYHHGATLSEQHTDLLILSLYKAGFVTNK